MKWRKLGQIFCPDGQTSWMHTHAANPVPEHLGNGMYRVYFSCRDQQARSHIGWVEFDIRNPLVIRRIAESPSISPGGPGIFDDSGASMGCLVEADDRKYLYYTGWNLSVTVPWRNSIGLAVASKNEEVFQKYSLAPLLDRSPVDPFSLSYPWVLVHEGMWRMWYGSNLSWGAKHRDMLHVLKYAESTDGISWNRTGEIAIPLQGPEEWGISKPCVRVSEGRFQMWYSIRTDAGYRLGFAESRDGHSWTRMDDEIGIHASESGWDSEMVEYPCVFSHEGDTYLLYNGNRFGRTGFGLAIME